jgi:hypothetical protein
MASIFILSDGLFINCIDAPFCFTAANLIISFFYVIVNYKLYIP